MSDKKSDYVSSIFDTSEITEIKDLSSSLDGFNQEQLLSAIKKLSDGSKESARLIFICPYIVNSSRKMKSFDFIVRIARNSPIADKISINGSRINASDNINYSALRTISIAICINSKSSTNQEFEDNCNKAITKWETSENGSEIRSKTKSKFKLESKTLKNYVEAALKSVKLI